MTTSTLPAGTVVDGRYTVSRVLRERPGATLYEATGAEGTVWLTVYLAAAFPSPLVLERTLRELRQLAGVSAPQIPKAVAAGKLPDGGMYEAHAPVEGAPLADRIASGPVPPAEAAQILQEVGDGLFAALQAGVTHRNLGPQTVWTGPAGVRLLGFSVGDVLEPGVFGPHGTIAPEQVSGKVVDQRTLVYNLAALAHALLTGRLLFPDVAAARAAHGSAGAPATRAR